MARLARPVFGILGAGATAAITAYVAITSPLTRNFGTVVIRLALLAFVSFVFLAMYDWWRERKQEQRDNDRDERLREILNWVSGNVIVGTAHGAQAPQRGGATGTVTNPKTLRQAAMELAKAYRDFADQYSGNPDDFMTEFWAQYPFKDLDEIKQRLKVPLGKFNVESAAEHLPMTPERVNRIANKLEEEALKVPEDVLL